MRTHGARGAVLLSIASIGSIAALAGCPGELANPERFRVDAGAVGDGSGSTCDAPQLLIKDCASCHGAASPAGNVRLDSPDAISALAGKPATGGSGTLVTPGAPDKSVLYSKLTTPTFGGPMPPDAPLGAQDLACVKSWIEGLPPVYTEPDADTGPTTVPVFVAVGHMGRTTISCDDGKTWVANRSDNDAIRCFDPDAGASATPDCDHDGHPGRGVVFSGGFFVANFGWGEPGNIRRSSDGVTWNEVFKGANFATTVVGNGKVVALASVSQISSDFGATWTPSPDGQLSFHSGGFAGGLFLLLDATTIATSADANTWTKLTTVPNTCGVPVVHGIEEAKDKSIVIAGEDGTICRSTDSGATWTSTKVASGISSRLIKQGSDLLFWGGTVADNPVSSLFRSTDGVTWTTMPIGLRGTANAPPIGAVAVSPSGTFVAVNAGWQVWYEKQKFYRSTDGLVWDELPAGAFTGSHPIDVITWGPAAPSSVCPLANAK